MREHDDDSEEGIHMKGRYRRENGKKRKKE
jgi:hypothetical protein